MTQKHEQEDKVFIYALFDPRTPEQIRYIGKTKNKPHKRVNNHINSAKKDNSYRANWINGLLQQHVRPDFKVIEECSSKS